MLGQVISRITVILLNKFKVELESNLTDNIKPQWYMMGNRRGNDISVNTYFDYNMELFSPNNLNDNSGLHKNISIENKYVRFYMKVI